MPATGFCLRFVPGVAGLVGLALLIPALITPRKVELVEDQYVTLVASSGREFQIASSRSIMALRFAMLVTTRAAALNMTEANKEVMAENFVRQSRYFPIVQQVRYISASGMEEVEVSSEWANETTLTSFTIHNSSALQNVSSQDYFAPSLALPRGQVFVTEIQVDDEENAASEAQSHILLASAAVFLMDDGPETPVGFVLVTLRADSLLSDIAADLDLAGQPYLSAGIGHTHLSILDSEGNWLYSSVDQDRAESGPNATFARMYPDVWAAVVSKAATTEAVATSARFRHGGSFYVVHTGNVCELMTEDKSTTATCPHGSSSDTYVLLRVPLDYILGPGLQPWELASVLLVVVGTLLWAAASSVLVAKARSEAAAVKRKISMAQFRTRNKDMFLQTMCHEIRTPLNAIVGAVSMLAGPDIPPSKLPLVGILEDGAQVILHVLNDILDVGKIESGQLHLSPREFRVRRSVGAWVEVHAVTALSKGVDVFLTVASGVPAAVIADDFRLRQMLSNLLSNAVKFTDSGSITVTVHALPPFDSRNGAAAAAGRAGDGGGGEGGGPGANGGAGTPQRPQERNKLQDTRTADSPVRVSAAAAGSARRKRLLVAVAPSPSTNLVHDGGIGSAPPRDTLSAAEEDLVFPNRTAKPQPALTPGRKNFPATPASFSASGKSASVTATAAKGAKQSGSHHGEDTIYLEFCVSDTGRGIAAEGLGRIFEPYEQEEVGTTRRYGGTGLGLTICRKLAEAMGGSIGVSSVIGRGSSFTIRIPVRLPPPRPSAAPPASGKAQPAPPSDHTMQPLVVAAAAISPAHRSIVMEVVARSSPRTRLVPTPASPSSTSAAETAAWAASSGAGRAILAVRAAWFDAVAAANAEAAAAAGLRTSDGGSGGERAATDAIASAVVIVDVSGLGEGALEGLAELRRLRESEPETQAAILLLLNGRAVHHEWNEAFANCYLVTMPVTCEKLLDALVSIAGAATVSHDSWRRAADASAPAPLPDTPRETWRAAWNSSEERKRYRRDLTDTGSDEAAASEASAVAGPRPRSPAAVLRSGALLPAAAPSSPPSPQLTLRVLVVDDVETNRRILQHMLVRLGHEVVMAADGEEAVAADERQAPPFHLVLMDLMMPGPLDGAEATASIVARHKGLAATLAAAKGSPQSPWQEQQQQPHRTPAVVILTASALDSDRERCLRAGAAAFMTKPLSWQRLKSFIVEDLPGLLEKRKGSIGG